LGLLPVNNLPRCTYISRVVGLRDFLGSFEIVNMSGISLDMMKKVELVEDHEEECPTLGTADQACTEQET
jgi:hypothetical protein